MKKRILMLMLCTALVSALVITTVFASGITKTIEVVFNSVNLAVNGVKVNADTILYNGTTYVPLRATADMLGKEVGWDQKTNTASIKDKAVPTPVVPAQTEGKLEYIVKDENGKALYSLKLNRAYATDERNQFSEKNPAQVVIIDYTYTNIANPDEVFISDILFKAIDAKGKIGYSYPGNITYYPQQIPVGVTCDAQMIFGLDNETDKLKLMFYASYGGEVSKTFEMPVE